MTVLSPSDRRTLLVANAICMASMIIWASGLPAANLIIPHMPPIALTAGRAALAALVLLPIWWLLEGRQTVLSANWLVGAWVGFVTLGLPSFFVIIALMFNDPVTVAIVTAVMPICGILLECLADHRPFTRALAIGLTLSVAGGLHGIRPHLQPDFLPRLFLPQGAVGPGLGHCHSAFDRRPLAGLNVVQS